MTRPVAGARQWLADQIPDAHSRRYRAGARMREWARDAGDLARGTRQRLGADPRGVTWGAFRIPAARSTTGNWLEQHRRSATFVSDALTAAGIRHFAYSDSTLRLRIGAVIDDQSQVIAALHLVAAPGPVVVGAELQETLHAVADLRVASGRTLNTAQTLRVACPISDPDAATVLGPECGVSVDRWWPESSGALRTAAPNRWASVIPREAQDAALLQGLPTFAPLTDRHVNDVVDPIDAVVTWVDGDDPAWRARRRQRVGDVADETRHRSIDELRYCLRSLRTYAPWIRTIHLITDDQRPRWLRDAPGLRLVDHRALWEDPSALPVFNSHAIETQLHRVPDLAEQYLYVNDDVFLARDHEPEDFFTGAGQARFFPSPTLRVGFGGEAGLPSAAARNDRRLLRELTGRVQTAKLEHTPHPQLRSVCLDLESRFPEAYATTSRSPLRDPADISPVTLAAWYGAATGRFVPAATEQRYWDLRTRDLAGALNHLRRERHLDTFCLNMGEEPGDRLAGNVATVADFLPRYFPFRTPWEEAP
ncbi:MAG: stealth family protein [Candidatus Nanopelagicales bacterium]